MNEILFILFAQVVIESLPVSSSGHVFLLKNFLKIDCLPKTFRLLDELSYGVTLIILAISFFPEWASLLSHFFSFKFQRDSYKKIIFLFAKIISLVFIIDLITAFFYLIRSYNLFGMYSVSNFSLFFGFLITALSLFSLYFLQSFYSKKNVYEPLNLRKALVLGLVQGLAFFPGISRLAVTYVAGCWMSLSPRRSLQVSCLIYVPLIAAAFFRSVLTFVFFKKFPFSLSELFVVGMLGTIVGYILFGKVRRSAVTGTFWRFGIYVASLSLFVFLKILHN